MKTPNGWTDTNYRERHLRRNGKIIAKISTQSGIEGFWYCYIHIPSLFYVGCARNEAVAKICAEVAAEKWRERR